MLLSLIFSFLSEEAMSEVIGASTSRDTWLVLEKVFAHKSKAREIRIKDSLKLIKRGSRTVSEYARKFNTLCDQLTAMGCSVDDTDKVHWFLHGLGTDFSSLSTTIMSQTPILAFKDVVPKAQSHDLFVKSLESPSLVAAYTA